jgi:hypothetical protein
MRAWRVVQHASRDEEAGWPSLGVVLRPPGVAFVAVQALADGALSPPVTVELRGTSLFPDAPAAAWASLGTLSLDAETPARMLGTGGLLDLTPFRWLRAHLSGGTTPCALLLAFDGDQME